MADLGQERFAGGDQRYLREEQYATTANLDARADIHARFATADKPWFPWLTAQVDWPAGPVLEVGCGTGAMWREGRPRTDGPVTLADLSVGMVEAAVAAASDAGYEVGGLVADAQFLSQPARSQAVVVANHMLYHLPEPARGVAELARVLADDGLVLVATNGERHLRQLKEIDREVFATPLLHPAVTAFGLETGSAMLEEAFAEVELRRYPDRLVVTEPTAVMAYLQSRPPGEHASSVQRERLERAVAERFAEGSMTIEKDVGLFLCRAPRR